MFSDTVSAVLPEVPQTNEQQASYEQSLFNLLPKPTKKKIEINEEDDEILHKKETVSEIKPKSRITVPSLDDVCKIL